MAGTSHTTSEIPSGAQASDATPGTGPVVAVVASPTVAC